MSCWEKAQRGPQGDFWNRQSLSGTCESASTGCALLLGLRLLASGFLLLDSHLHRVFLPLCLLLDISCLLPQRALPGSTSSPESSAACGLSISLFSDACLPALWDSAAFVPSPGPESTQGGKLLGPGPQSCFQLPCPLGSGVRGHPRVSLQRMPFRGLCRYEYVVRRVTL